MILRFTKEASTGCLGSGKCTLWCPDWPARQGEKSFLISNLNPCPCNVICILAVGLPSLGKTDRSFFLPSFTRMEGRGGFEFKSIFALGLN